MLKWLQMLAEYNHWANERLYEASSKLSDTQYREDRGAFFASMHGTLNHLLIGDRIWLSRFVGGKNEPRELDGILFESFQDLWQARQQEDARIKAYIASLDERKLTATITYRTTRSPTIIEQELGPLLVHFFNHQTHHRGQAHCILTGLTGEAPSLDLFVYQRETGDSIIRGHGNLSRAPERRPG